MSRESKRKLTILGIYSGVTVLTAIVFKYMLPLVAPFLIAFIIATLIEKPVSVLEERAHIKRTISAVIFILLTSALLCLGLFYGAKLFVKQVTRFAGNYDLYMEKLSKYAKEYCKHFDSCFCIKNGSSFEYISNQARKTVEHISDTAMSSVMDSSFNLVAGFTMVFTAVAICIMSTIFIAKDMKNIKSKTRKSVFGKEVFFLGHRLKTVLGSYFKTELIIMTITSAICILGLFLLKNEYAFVIGILIGLIDALPILGTGTVFIPWVLVLLVIKQFKKAIFIFIIYLVCYYTRQFLEPKLMGDKLGVSPIMMLLAIYVGLRLFGIIGVFTGPVALILIKELSAMLIKNL